MKPLFQFPTPQRSRRGDELPSESRSSCPSIDRHYHAPGDFHAVTRAKKTTPSVSLRQLSNGFFAKETKRDYLLEALCFVIMIGVSAWPIGLAIRALSLLK
jgi:hypothetical protein